MRKLILSILIFLSVVVLLLKYGYPLLMQKIGTPNRSGLKIDSTPTSNVYLCKKDNQNDCTNSLNQVGKTPYSEENLTSGEYLVKIETENSATSSSKLAPWQGYVKLNPGTLSVVNRELSQTATASSGEVITLQPGDGVTVVSAPTDAKVTIDGQEKGRTPLTISDIESGEHTFIISHDNFLNRSIRANLIDGYNLRLTIDLALSDADLTKNSTPPISGNQIVVVKNTPVGFLRVREDATVNAKEVTQLKPGEELTLLEELPNWDRIRTKDGKEGYVSSAYVRKK